MLSSKIQIMGTELSGKERKWIRKENNYHKVWKEIVLEYQERYPDGIPTEIFAKVFAEKMVREFAPYLNPPINKKEDNYNG